MGATPCDTDGACVTAAPALLPSLGWEGCAGNAAAQAWQACFSRWDEAGATQTSSLRCYLWTLQGLQKGLEQREQGHDNSPVGRLFYLALPPSVYPQARPLPILPLRCA